jgi:alpha-ribazole phosphatase
VLLQLLRHGETEAGGRYFGSTDVALSVRGWEQMRAAVAGYSWERIISSPLQRCAAFAEAMAAERHLSCRYDEDLREISFGEWEGHSAAQLMQTDVERLRRFWSDPNAHPAPGGESLVRFHARVMAAWWRILSDPDRRRPLIITHGGPIRVLRAVQSGTPLSALLSIEVAHAALIAIESADDSCGATDPSARSSALSAAIR